MGGCWCQMSLASPFAPSARAIQLMQPAESSLGSYCSTLHLTCQAASETGAAGAVQAGRSNSGHAEAGGSGTAAQDKGISVGNGSLASLDKDLASQVMFVLHTKILATWVLGNLSAMYLFGTTLRSFAVYCVDMMMHCAIQNICAADAVSSCNAPSWVA